MDQDSRTSSTPPPAKPGSRKNPQRTPFKPRKTPSVLTTMRAPDYLIIGHITADLLEDGSVTLGGTALYSALTAHRLGARVAVLTRGLYGRTIRGMKVPALDHFADRLQIIVQDADVPTTYVNDYLGSRRVQHVRHWAGPIDLRGLPTHWANARIVHLGPVADEIDPRRVIGLGTDFLGVTPQGWLRDWPRATGGRVTHVPLRLPGDLVSRIDCAVVSDEEIFQTRELIEAVGGRRLSVVTRGPMGATIYHAIRPEERDARRPGEKLFRLIEIPGIDVTVQSLTGAGDVFAAAFFLKAADRRTSALQAGTYANVVAGLSLRQIGADSIPSTSEIDAFMAAH